jgi:hypothetical protein
MVQRRAVDVKRFSQSTDAQRIQSLAVGDIEPGRPEPFGARSAESSGVPRFLLLNKHTSRLDDRDFNLAHPG